MHKELLSQSPLLALPLAALLIFLAVFVYVIVNAMTQARAEVAAAAKLPLGEADDER